MQKTTFRVYYTTSSITPSAEDFDFLNSALTFSEEMRKAGHRFVTIVSENVDSVGKPGVDTIAFGRTPDGVPYTWVKRRAAEVIEDLYIEP